MKLLLDVLPVVHVFRFDVNAEEEKLPDDPTADVANTVPAPAYALDDARRKLTGFPVPDP